MLSLILDILVGSWQPFAGAAFERDRFSAAIVGLAGEHESAGHRLRARLM